MSVGRNGTFSSSSAWRLMTNNTSGKPFGAQGLSYIRQVNNELKLGRAINPEREARPTSWGTLVERRAFDLLPTDYQHVTDVRLFHPSLPWSGAPDLKKVNTVGDIKGPFSLDVFCNKLKALEKLEVYKKEFQADYWQHISNAVLMEVNGLKVTHFEAVIYCPYQSELADIRSMAEGDPRYYWIWSASDEELPFILDGGNFKNLNVFRFEIPQADKLAMIERVELAKEELTIPQLQNA